MNFILYILILSLSTLCLPASATELISSASLPAQEGREASSPAHADIQTFLRILENDASRQDLIHKLKANPHPQIDATPLSSAAVITPLVDQLFNRAHDYVTQFYHHTSDIVTTLQDPKRMDKAWSIFTLYAAIFTSAFFLQIAFIFLIARTVHKKILASSTRISGIMVAILFEGIGIAAFSVMAFMMLQALSPPDKIALSLEYLILALIYYQVLYSIARVLLSPHEPRIRLLPIETPTARVTGFFLTGSFILMNTNYILGSYLIQVGKIEMLALFIGRLTFLIFGYLILLYLRDIKPFINSYLQKALSQTNRTSFFRRFSEKLLPFWHPIASAYVTLLVILFALFDETGFNLLLKNVLKVTFFTIIAYIISLKGSVIARRIVHMLTDPFGIPSSRKRFYEVCLLMLLYFIIASTYIFLTLKTLGISTTFISDYFEEKSFFTAFTTLILTSLVGIIIWESLEHAIIKIFKQLERSSTQRNLPSLLALVLNVTRLVMFVLTLLVALSEFGFNITPFLASAGVLGLAVSLGSQTLVNDVIKGFFILTEDTISLGDHIVVGEDKHEGIVEELTLRSVKLRDNHGAVHVVPFSAITAIVNHSRP